LILLGKARRKRVHDEKEEPEGDGEKQVIYERKYIRVHYHSSSSSSHPPPSLPILHSHVSSTTERSSPPRKKIMVYTDEELRQRYCKFIFKNVVLIIYQIENANLDLPSP
jgi:hypothetical protein